MTGYYGVDLASFSFNLNQIAVLVTKYTPHQGMSQSLQVKVLKLIYSVREGAIHKGAHMVHSYRDI